jgi:hypothetical protein
MKSKYVKWLALSGMASLALAGGYVRAQNPQGPPFGGPGGFQQEEAVPLPPSKVTIEEREGYRYITSNGVPNHEVGAFPNPNNPNAIRAQNYKFRVPLQPKAAEKITVLRHDLFGVASSGVPFDPATAEFWNNDRRWNYDALSGKLNLGTDMNNAHVQPGGVYHYHGLPQGLIARLTKTEAKKEAQQKEPSKQITMLGYAADGFPIYAQQGHAVADDAKSPLKKLRSSYRLKEGTRPGGNEGPGGAYDGTFSADWEYVAKSGDLDECNGRTGVTPEYPQGTYYYVLTDEFPFVPRSFKGTPDASFTKPRPQGGQGGPGGGPNGGRGGGPGGRGGPGFGPPPPGFGPPPPGFGPPPPGFGPPPPRS